MMKNYVVFDPATGEIFAHGICPGAAFELQRRDGMGLIEAVASGETHYIVDSVPVAYTEEQAAAKRARPGASHRWSNQTFSWVDQRSAEQIAAGKAAGARERRDRLLAESDWTDTLSARARLGDALYQAWQDYRQALRDITRQPGFPSSVTWPAPPANA